MKLVSTYLQGNLTDYEYDPTDYRVKYDLDNRIVEVKADSECAEYEHRASQNDIMGHPIRLNSVIARDTEDRENRVELQWYHKNYLDHVYAVSDDNGNLVEHYRYTAFGEPEIYRAYRRGHIGGDRTGHMNADDETTTNVYDVRNRLKSSTDANQITTSYTYDANNNLRTLTDGNGNDRQWIYDSRNLNVTKIYPGNEGNDFYRVGYDALNRLAIKVDQIGTSCTNVYDLAGRMIEKQYHTGATPALGGVVTAGASLESTDTFTFDAASRVIATRKGRYNIRTQHSYALDSQPLTETIIANREVYTSSRTYDAANRPLSHTFPNGKTTQWSYTSRNLVNTVRYEGELIATNTYDAGFRQTNQNYGNGLKRVITYARQDNLRSTDRVLTKDGDTESRDHSVSDQITQLDGNPVSHDLKGNLTKYKYDRNTYKVKYDLDNRIFSVKSNRRKVTYRYDAFGRRIISKKNGNRTALIWWGDSECAEYKHRDRQRVVQHDIMGHPTKLNSVIARDTARGKRKVKLQWYHKNYLDHVYAVSDDNGNLIEHYRYTAFGEPEIYSTTGSKRNTSAIGNAVMWNTRRYDADNGLYYYKYRHYAANIGRWLGRDPIEEKGGINLYGFVGNEPFDYWDRLGEACKIKMWCQLQSESGLVNTSCEYKCTEIGRKSSRIPINSPLGGTIRFCDSIAYPAKRVVKKSGFCGCGGNFEKTMTIVTDLETCSHSKCVKKCNLLGEVPGTVSKPIQLAAQAAIRACLAACDAVCKEP